ncbi:hypothetical protein RRF57_008368 [Xylaria bambusicola]|uniref:Uncharacterized protein n=1 Tax=Xylaria bambusicola TaxID=326684 RepID=A0AAN7UX45_9PEZI
MFEISPVCSVSDTLEAGCGLINSTMLKAGCNGTLYNGTILLPAVGLEDRVEVAVGRTMVVT